MTNEMNAKLLDIVACPITRRPLKRLSDTELTRVNAAIAAGSVRNHGGHALDKPLDAALVTEDGDLVYPVRSGVPILFEEECIHWAAYK